MASARTFEVDLPDDAATARLAEDIAAALVPGDVVALSGGLGAGKTTLARALIRAISAEPALEVPSPTFTLVQAYSGGRVPIAHFDLYRLTAPDELVEIGFDDARLDGAVLVEWPERAGDRLPPDRLEVALEIVDRGRRAKVTTAGSWPERMARSRAARAFLDRSGYSGALRRHLQGDASARVYERITAPGGRHAVLMDWPPVSDEVGDDRRSRFRARDVRAFAAVDNALREIGLSAPEIYAADYEAGFLLLEDLGSEGMLRDGLPDADRYRAAIGILAEIHRRPLRTGLPIPGSGIHQLPAYTAEAFAVEVDLFADWYVPHATGRALSIEALADFKRHWAGLIDRLGSAEIGWVLLDMHSPNLLWLDDREGLKRVGLLDFQDLLAGPSAYDVASLCQDARASVPPPLEAALREHYVGLRRASDPAFDAETFREAYAILAAQRATKILGVFARLAEFAGREQYLQHMPRLREYLARSLAHPALTGYALWYRRHLSPAP